MNYVLLFIFIATLIVIIYMIKITRAREKMLNQHNKQAKKLRKQSIKNSTLKKWEDADEENRE